MYACEYIKNHCSTLSKEEGYLEVNYGLGVLKDKVEENKSDASTSSMLSLLLDYSLILSNLKWGDGKIHAELLPRIEKNLGILSSNIEGVKGYCELIWYWLETYCKASYAGCTKLEMQ